MVIPGMSIAKALEQWPSRSRECALHIVLHVGPYRRKDPPDWAPRHHDYITLSSVTRDALFRSLFSSVGRWATLDFCDDWSEPYVNKLLEILPQAHQLMSLDLYHH